MNLIALGTALILIALVFTAWWVLGERKYKGWALTVGLADIFAGGFFVLNERITELTIPKIGTIKAAAAQATADAAKVKQLSQSVTEASERIAKVVDYVQALESELSETREHIATIDEKVTALPAAPGPPRLEHSSSTFSITPTGIDGRVLFRPTSSATLSSVEFIVTVVGTTNSRIEEISPAASVSLMVTTAVSPDGRQGRVRYRLLSGEPPGFRIELTGAATLRVEGSPGLDPIEVEAVPGAA